MHTMPSDFMSVTPSLKNTIPRMNVPIAPRPVHTQYAVLIGMFLCAKYKNTPLRTMEATATTMYSNFCEVT